MKFRDMTAEQIAAVSGRYLKARARLEEATRYLQSAQRAFIGDDMTGFLADLETAERLLRGE